MVKKSPKKYTPNSKEKYMCAKHKKYFNERLVSWRKEIIKSNTESVILNNMDDNSASADIVDQASSQTEKSVELRASNRRRKLVNKIDQALKKIKDGTYGFCEETGEPIGLKRLIARPIATLSIEAQERHEKEEKIFIDTNLLEKKIKEEIIRITTERVGLLINEMPEEFLNKIKLLSNTIIKNSGKKIFKLNPEDLKLVEKIIKGDSALEKWGFLADNTLARGDCIIEIGEISIEDKIIDRYDSSESSTRYFEIGKKENKVEEISHSDEVEDNETAPNVPEISEKEDASIEISQIDQDIEQAKSAEFNPDEIIEISEDENLTSTPVSSSNTDQKDQDKT